MRSGETLLLGPLFVLCDYAGWYFDKSVCGRSDPLASEDIVLDEVSQRPFLMGFILAVCLGLPGVPSARNSGLTFS